MKKQLFLFLMILLSLTAFASTNNIEFVDANVKAICVANWDTSGDGELSYDEAAAVTDLGTVLYYNNMTSFDELQYFTGLKSISNFAFRCCSNLASIIIPSNVTIIGDYAFDRCSSLTSIIIPSNVTSIGEWAFTDCTSLTSVTIPSNVKNIGNYAFLSCNGLVSVTISEGVTSIGNGAFSWCKGLTSLTIPSSVTSNGIGAFEGCSSLTSVTISEGVTSIGNSAFQYCSGLTSITIPSSVTSIGDNAFNYCSGLTNLIIYEGVTSIGEDAFSGCTNLTTVKVPVTDFATFCNNRIVGIISGSIRGMSVTLIDSYGNEIKEYNIPSGVTSIGDNAFTMCPGLTSVTIPSSVTNIGYNAFGACGLTSVTIPSSVTSIGEYAFVYCTRLTDLTIQEGVTTIGNYVFGWCTSLTSVNIPSSVTSIGNNAFAWCYGLTSVTIPSSVTSIGESAFTNCYGLTNLTIPSSVTSIGERAFYWCSGLKSVTSLIEEPFGISANVFSLYNYDTEQDSFTSATLYVPAGTKSLYEATPAWNQFQNIVEMEMEPIDQSETINFGNDINGGTDLNGNVVGDIYYNISAGDGSYNAAEGCIVVTTPTDDSAISGQDIFGEDFKAGFTGIVFKVPTGKGTVKVEAQTTGTMVLKVKIGDNDPIEMELEGRLKVSFPYNVSEPTYVYIYGGTTSAAPDMAGRASASGELKLYGIEVSPDATGIESLTPTLSQREGAWYTLDGQMLNGKPTQKGIYIYKGKKVAIK